MSMTHEELQEALDQAIEAGEFEHAHAIEQQLKQQPVDFNVGTMVKNIPSSAARYVGGIKDAVMNPVDTVNALGGLVQGTANKIGRKTAELVTGQEQEPMPEYSEAAPDAVGQHVADRYGSIDKAQQTLMDDPVGVLGDVAGVGTASRIPGVAKVAAIAEPTMLMVKGARQLGKWGIPKNAAINLYQKAAKFSTAKYKTAERAAIIQTALDYGVMPTARGVRKVDSRIDVLNSGLDVMIENATNAGKTVPVDDIFGYLQDLRKTKGGVRLGGQDDLKMIDKIAADFRQDMKILGKKDLTIAEVQNFKKEAYKSINWNAKNSSHKAGQVAEDTSKNLARRAKDIVGENVPGAGAANEELSRLYELQQPLGQATNRLENRNMLSINTPLNIGAATLAGEATGNTALGVALGVTATVLGNPKTKTMLAIAMNKISKGDVKWLEANIANAQVRVALSLAGSDWEPDDTESGQPQTGLPPIPQ